MSEPVRRSNSKHPPPSSSALEMVLDEWGRGRKQHFIPIAGRSMLPLIQDGDQVLVAHGCTDVRRGDVIVYRQHDRLIAHRVLRFHISQSGPIFITKGDNSRSIDPPVMGNEVIGRVLSIERGRRSIPLDTILWQKLGWFIALYMLAWVKLDDWTPYFNHSLWGSNRNPLTAILHRVVQVLLYFVFRVIEIITCQRKQ